MRRLRLVLASPLLLAFLSVACKQEIGERCEQPSDCASGYCGGSSTINDMTSAEGHICSSGPPPPPMIDAAPANDAGSTGDAAADGATEASASEAGGDTPSEAGDAAAEASSDASSGGADAAAAETGADAGDLGADAPAGG